MTTLIDYPNYYADVAQFLFLFVAAQAPELLGRDQRFQVLTLYFSRALRRSDYVVARFLALVAAIFGILLAPQVLLYLGRALAAADVAAGLRADAGRIAPVVAQAALVALVLAALGLAVSAFMPRRAYAIAAIIAAIIVPPIVSGVVAGGDLAAYVRLISISDVLKGTNDFVFGLPIFGSDPNPILTPPVAVAVALVGSAVLLAIILRRYARISA